MPNHPDDASSGPIELSVVVPAFNAAATIGAQLDALQRQHWDAPWEVIVADNGSTDNTAALVAQRAATDGRIRLVDASDARGAAHARNRAVAAARGSVIAFCDADDVVGAGWVAAMGSALKRTPFVTGPQEYKTLNEPRSRAPPHPCCRFNAAILPSAPVGHLTSSTKLSAVSTCWRALPG